MDWRRSAERARLLVAHAERKGNAAEAGVAEEKLAALIRELDLELLKTLAEQRSDLREAAREELRRLREPNARANLRTRELLAWAMLLLGHWEAIDVLPSAVALERIRAARE